MEATKKGSKPSKYSTEGEGIAWHSGFLSAMKLELSEYKDNLQFICEYQLTTEPLRMDLLIIKKDKDIPIEKNIAAIFRRHNIVEYKSPASYIPVKDFYKVLAYVHLYAYLEPEADITEITLTFIESRYPRKLLAHLKNVLNYKVEETQSGVYTVIGGIVPIQIVNSRKLSDEDNFWLKNLDDKLGAMKVLDVLTATRRTQDVDTPLVRPYINVVLNANPDSLEEGEKMRKKKRTLEDVLEELGYYARAEKRAKAETARNALAEGASVEFVKKITGLDMRTIRRLKSECQTV